MFLLKKVTTLIELKSWGRNSRDSRRKATRDQSISYCLFPSSSFYVWSLLFTIQCHLAGYLVLALHWFFPRTLTLSSLKDPSLVWFVDLCASASWETGPSLASLPLFAVYLLPKCPPPSFSISIPIPISLLFFLSQYHPLVLEYLSFLFLYTHTHNN